MPDQIDTGTPNAPQDELEYVRWEIERLREREQELTKQIEASDADT